MKDTQHNSYQVIDTLKHDGQSYSRGDTVEMTAAQAARCPAVGGRVNSADDSHAVSDIRDAISKLELNNDNHWTKDRKPEVKALSAMLDRVVTASDRDLAWQQVLDENG